MLFVYLYFSVYDSTQVLLITRIEDSPFASLLVLVWTKKTLQDMQYQTTDNVFNRIPKHLKVHQKCPTARVLLLFSAFGNAVKQSWEVSTCLTHYTVMQTF